MTLMAARSWTSSTRPAEKVIAHVTLADEEDARCAIAAAKQAFASFGRTTKEERIEILRRLHEAVSAPVDDLTDVMIEEYGGVVQFAGAIVQSAASVFLAAEKALKELPLTWSWDETVVIMELVGVAGYYALERERILSGCW